MCVKIRVSAALVLLCTGLAGCMPLEGPQSLLTVAADPVDPLSLGKARFLERLKGGAASLSF